MPRKLKTYVTSVGFFEQAVAAPSMKAALEAWGASPKAFHQGFAEETDDPAIVAATMAKPGVILKRAVGTTGVFTENAELPTSLPVGKIKERRKPPEPKAKAAKPKKGRTAKVISLADKRAAKEAAAAYEKEEARREKEETKAETVREKERERRDEAVARAEAAMKKARTRHDDVMESIASERKTLDQREEDEEARWNKEKRKLDAAIERAGD